MAPKLSAMKFLLRLSVVVLGLAVLSGYALDRWAARRQLLRHAASQPAAGAALAAPLAAVFAPSPNLVLVLDQENGSPFWRALYGTRQAFEKAKESLPQGAIFALELPLAVMSRASARLMLSELAAAFPAMRVFYLRGDLIALASSVAFGEAELKRAAERINQAPAQAQFAALGIDSLQSLLAHELWLARPGFAEEGAAALRPLRLLYWALRDAYYQSSVDADGILLTPDEWRWSLIYSKQSLLALYLKQSGGKIDLAKIVAAGCGPGKVDLIEPNWRYLRTPCRDAVVAAIAFDPDTTPQHLQREFSWIRDFMDPQTASALPGANEPLQQVIDRIYWFAEMDSIFLPLAPKRLTWISSKCYSMPAPDYLFCRRELVRALSYAGYFDAAAQELKSLQRDGAGKVDEQDVENLGRYLANAREVK